jgi:hypothetical protein
LTPAVTESTNEFQVGIATDLFSLKFGNDSLFAAFTEDIEKVENDILSNCFEPIELRRRGDVVLEVSIGETLLLFTVSLTSGSYLHR